MRMWNVKPKLLCNKHLLGEHVEMHMFVGTINKSKNIDGYIDNGLVEINNIKKRHSELVQEMLKRGMNHQSPLPEILTLSNYDRLGNVDADNNIKELAKRCKDCKKRILEGNAL